MAAPPRVERHKPHFHKDQPWKEPVRVATTANITIATALNVGDTIDGVTLADADRVLVKNQSTGSQNGLYIAGATPARAYDGEQGSDILGTFVAVLEGTTNGGTVWRNTNATLPTVGTTALTFSQVPLSAGVSALDDLSDVAITSPLDKQRLRYNATTGRWENSSLVWEVHVSYDGTVVLDGAGNPVQTEVTY